MSDGEYLPEYGSSVQNVAFVDKANNYIVNDQTTPLNDNIPTVDREATGLDQTDSSGTTNPASNICDLKPALCNLPNPAGDEEQHKTPDTSPPIITSDTKKCR